MSLFRAHEHDAPHASEGKTTAADCPSCGHPLDPRPSRKVNCPHCGEIIRVRKPYLMTEREYQYEKWSFDIEDVGLSRQDIDFHRDALAEQFGFDPGVNDVIWRVLNSLISVGQAKATMKKAYFHMAELARSEGKDPRPYLVEHFKIELAGFKASEVITKVAIRTMYDDETCPHCKKLEGKVLDIDEAITKLPVPNLCSSEIGCRCFYIGEP